MKTSTRNKTYKIAMIGMLSAIAFVLEALNFPIPVMPSFIKVDFSELPALIGSFALGPVSGIAICFIKNLFNLLMHSDTGGVGELSNFLLGMMFVGTAGIIYKIKRGKKAALIGSVIGAVVMALFSIVSNYFLVYPFYMNVMGMPKEVILGMYQAINPNVDTLLEALIKFNVPFTFCKAMMSVLITFLIYKRISPIIKGSFLNKS
ncbi:MAG: ECF transporter S component [Lachnospiraceae bacterium]|nr:ECF transporter S component [Lachnospiraceae bacterium]